MTQTFVLGSQLNALSIQILNLYRASAEKNRQQAKILREAIFHQGIALLTTCYQTTFSAEQIAKMRGITFRNGVIVFPLAEARMGTPRETRLEFHISPAERVIYLVRYMRNNISKMHVLITTDSALLAGYQFELLRPISGIRSSVLQDHDDKAVFSVDTYARLNPEGRYLEGKNFPRRDFNIREMVAKICDLRIDK